MIPGGTQLLLTDRAHRIGQEKLVFVYKLRTLGTGGKTITSLDAEEIAALFAPIDG